MSISRGERLPLPPANLTVERSLAHVAFPESIVGHTPLLP